MSIRGNTQREEGAKIVTKLEFYYIDQNYINYLKQFDRKIPTKNRPYLKIKIKNKDYYLPLYSPREKHKQYYMNNTFFRIYDFYNNYIGLIRFSNMIPIPKRYVKKINFNYSNKLYQEYFYISKHQNQILRKVNYTYNNYDELKELCVNFKLLEKIIS